MGFIDVLNKEIKRINIAKTELYQTIANNHAIFEANGLTLHLRNEIDIFGLEIILTAFKNKRIIDDTYSLFCYNHSDVADYLTYAEKRDMFNIDLEEVLEGLPQFVDEESGITIYMPIYEPFMNEYFRTDYQLTRLKQHREYMRLSDLNPQSPYDRYGPIVYDSAFSCLVKVYEDDDHMDYYYDEMQLVMIFDQETFDLVNIVTLADGKGNRTTSEDARIIMPLFEHGQYFDAITLMYSLHFITEKSYDRLVMELEKER
ncbi:MAG: hypothetical protein J6P61_02170 [Erysipelotrichaceae bacterium]|nr:hypothetical protein [Erysipelotrichaceae bacterium]